MYCLHVLVETLALFTTAADPRQQYAKSHTLINPTVLITRPSHTGYGVDRTNTAATTFRLHPRCSRF